MEKRICSMIILGFFLATTVTPNIVNAAVKTDQTIRHSSKISQEEAIKIIENKYLVKKTNGTLSISPNAVREIPSDILSCLKSGLDYTNSKIIEGNLSTDNNKNFDIKVKKNFKVESNNKFMPSNKDITINKSVVGASTAQILNYSYKYKWYWWGFAVWVKSTGTQLLINNLERDRNILLLTGTVSAFLTCGIGLAVSALTAGGLERLIGQTKDALVQTGSSIIYCYGSPSRAQVYKVTSTW